MAAATKKNQQTPPAATTVDPKFEWAEKAGSYVLRLALPGLRKDDFRVQVDGAGRLTVRGSSPAPAGQSSFHKVFQLPSAASLEDIAGRFEAGVLTLTMPKRASSAGASAAPTSIEEIKRKQPSMAKEEGAKPPPGKELDEKKVAAKPKEEASKTAMDEATKKTQQQEDEEANRRKQEQKPGSAVKKEKVKPKSPTPAPKPEAATGDKSKAAIAPAESLAERVKRRGEEEHANAARMAAAKRAKTDGEKKATPACGGWKERVAGELKVLTDMKWADGVVEAARNNKEVVAVGIAAFSLGFLVSQKLFRK